MKEMNTDLIVEFHVFLYSTETVIQKWEVEYKQVRDYKITLDFFNDIELETNHPLLLEYLEPTQELYFKGESKNVFKIIGELLIQHQKIMDNWIDFQHYFNGDLEWLLKQSQGLLAKGPESIITTYKKVLEINQLHPSVIKFDLKLKKSLVAIMGKSFIICEEVEFNRIL
ncbi:hypothetical protein [Saccharibacillus sp. JS10]|uniref:hypothetical protein n=1 Tax=Saccharibacillus sp. JS10 TaxID=2950552 RepID=UPI00210B2F31|nr:hypothetical protein [Saccharibacillus sp. JS10]MCQ4088445.1 hypothetical protein [Saccharibacillus sp. JS10]